MTNDDRVAALLDRYTPDSAARSDWAAVLHDAGVPARGRRRGVLLLVLAAVLASVSFVAVLAWPGGSDRVSVVERALAAIGPEPVLHVVFESELGYHLVDLDSGERRVLHREREVWYDPARGLHEVTRFEGVIQSDARLPAGEGDSDALYREFATGYRAALESGAARVVGRDVIRGEPVHWIRVSTRSDDIGEYAEEVAVSERTFRPVYIRLLVDGRPLPGGGARVISFETLPEGAGDFPTEAPAFDGFSFSGGGISGKPISFEKAARILKQRPLWAGPSVRGLPLVRVDRWIARWSPHTEGLRDWIENVGVQLFYGTLHDDGEARTGRIGNPRRPHVQIVVTTTLDPTVKFELGIGDYRPPDGTILILRRRGLMRAGNLYVVIEASNRELIVDSARALRAYRR